MEDLLKTEKFNERLTKYILEKRPFENYAELVIFYILKKIVKFFLFCIEKVISLKIFILELNEI